MLIIVGNLCAFVVAHIYLFINFIYDFCDNLKLATRRRSALSATDRGALFSHSHRRPPAPLIWLCLCCCIYWFMFNAFLVSEFKLYYKIILKIYYTSCLLCLLLLLLHFVSFWRKWRRFVWFLVCINFYSILLCACMKDPPARVSSCRSRSAVCVLVCVCLCLSYVAAGYWFLNRRVYVANFGILPCRQRVGAAMWLENLWFTLAKSMQIFAWFYLSLIWMENFNRNAGWNKIK